MKKSLLLFALPLFGMVMTGCEKKNKQDVVEATITLDQASVTLFLDDTVTLVPTVAFGSGDVTWTSSNDAVATVVNGVVTAHSKGTATITATYSGITATCTVSVHNFSDKYGLEVQENTNIKDFKNNVNSAEFKGETEKLLNVGDDNPFVLKPTLKILDLETFQELPESVWKYDYEFKLEKWNGEAYAATEEEFGTFDAKNCTFDFNDAAIGKQFKLTVMPGGLSVEEQADPNNSKSVEVKVKDGYNVYTENELAYFNDINFLDTNRQSNHPANVNNAWKEFRTTHGLLEEHVAHGIYLQKTLQLTRANMPDVFFYTAAEAGGNDEWVGKMKDCSDIYCHYADGFEFNGNYFHIDTTQVPLGVDDPGLGYDDNVSHSTLFKIAYEGTNTEKTEKEVFLGHCSYFGNGLRSGEDEDNSMGLIFFKIQNHLYNNNTLVKATFDQFNIKGAVISFFSEYGEAKMIVKNSVVQEGYSNGFYLWNNGIVELENSFFKNFGGPVFITDGSKDNTVNGFKITSDAATVFDNWVSGNEPWFAHTKGGGPQAAIPQIQGLDGYVQGISNAFGTPRTFLKPVETDEGTVKFMNFIIINYGEIPDVTFQKGEALAIGTDKSDDKRATIVDILDNEGKFVLETDNGGLAKVVPDAEHPGYDVLSAAGFGGTYLDVLGKMPGFGYLSLFFEFNLPAE